MKFPFVPGDYIKHKNGLGDVIWKINAVSKTYYIVADKPKEAELLLTPVYNPETHPDLALMALEEPDYYAIKHKDFGNWTLALRKPKYE